MTRAEWEDRHRWAQYKIETLGFKYPRIAWVDGGAVIFKDTEENKTVWGFSTLEEVNRFINKYKKAIITRIYFKDYKY